MVILNLTVQEKIMYEVMKAIYESGIPISFKGSMVLRAGLLEAGYDEETRHTLDIDANWNSDTPPTAEQLTKSLQKAIDTCGLQLEVRLYRMYAENRSAGFEVVDRETDDLLFTIDIDVNRPLPPTKIYEINEIRFCGISPIQIIADKLDVISTDKIFRRIKDIVDLYYISKVFDFNSESIRQALKDSNRELGDFNAFLNRTDELKHSYDKFRFTGDVSKPPFDEIYNNVKAYISDIM